MTKLLQVLAAILILGCGHPSYKNPHIVISTSFGDIEAELYPEQAPKTVAAFLSYVDSGFYTGGAFYRAVLQEGLSAAANTGIIQGGIYRTNDKQHPNVPGIQLEPTNQTKLSHTSGTLSLARTAPNSGNTEFFICVGDQTQFDYGNRNGGDSLGFGAFGRVISGMPIVKKIQDEPRHGETLDEMVTIQKIVRL